MRFGAHMSIAGGVASAFDRAEKAGCDALQVFTKNNNQWNAKDLSEDDVERFQTRQKETGIGPVVAHDSYLINLASPKDDLWEKSIAAFEIELKRCEQLSIPYLVTHPGSHTGAGEEVGLQRVADALNKVHADLPDCSTMTLLEVTAGQGTALGYAFQHLADIVNKVDVPNRVGYCFDTCHAFAAGYDFRTEAGYAAMMDEFDELLGLDRLKAFHLNDSKKPVGSRVDRHDHIGQGEIGIEAFGFLVNDARFAECAALLETRKSEDLHEDVENLERLRSLISS